MTTPRRIAEAFSRHHFRETYEALAPDVRWTSVGAGELTDRDAVIEACEAALTEFAFAEGRLTSITSYAVELAPTES